MVKNTKKTLGTNKNVQILYNCTVKKELFLPRDDNIWVKLEGYQFIWL